jgi:integrase
MDCQALYNLVVVHTREAFGRSVNPHLFRDCAATGVAVEDPAHVGIGAPLLGHRSRATMERHYNQAGSVEAARRWHRTLARLRNRSRSSVAPGRRCPDHGSCSV